MKKTILFLMACFCFLGAHAAYLRNIPMTLTQPDGTMLHCYASGDEFFNYLHDENGFTIMQHPQTGFYVYADKQNGKLVATDYVAGSVDPASKNLQPFNLLSPDEWLARRNDWREKEKLNISRDDLPNHGTLNNIAIFIRFSDDAQFTNTYSSIDNMFNDVSTNAVSMRSYFTAASYGAIEIPTTFYPGHNGETIISYQDTYPRSYFQPYNETTNPNGYQGEDDRREREFSLLERTVSYINANYPVPTNLNIDYDSDGYVDNVCFIVKGGVGAWSSLLWPHKWSLYDRTVRINGKRVWTFNFQLADATDYFNTSTMCHEMNHSLGAPDLYHYYYGTSLNPVGTWDLMEYNMTPPQHCGAYMKMKYSHWVDEIPEITEPGTYTLNPISSATPTNIAYKIATGDPNQFYVLEYRDNTSLFETALPGSGLLIYRIDTRFDGNVDFNPDEGVYDEVYLFRPEGSSTENGNFYSAYFSAGVDRTEFSSSTSAYPFYSDGTPDHNFRIYDITSAGNTISFTYGPESGAPEGLYLGDGGSETNSTLPSYNYYNYSLSQQIYTSDEMGEEGIITSIAFYNGGSSKSRSYDFYLKNTTKSSFSDASDWVAVSASDLVFSGMVTMASDRWTVIDLDVPFVYDGTSNVVLVADDNTGEWTSSPHMTCRVYGAPSQALRVYGDYNNFDPMTPPVSYSSDEYAALLDVKNQLILNKAKTAMQVYADYCPNMNDPMSPYVRVHWGNEISNVEDFERADFSMFNWQLDPTYPWAITTNDAYEGNYCMKSGNEGMHSTSSSMEVMLTIPNAGQISFFSKISSESGWDYGYFYIDGVQQDSYSGNGTWGERTFAIAAGAHTFTWTYTKDGSVNRYDDCFYVDYIRFYASDAFAYDFENSRLPVGWTTIDADGDGYDWSMGSDVMSVGYGRNGSNDMVLSQSYNFSQGALYPDNYLVSEQVNITNGSHFTFWACAQDASWAAEHFGVYVSLGSNTNPSDFQEVQSWTMSSKGGGRPIKGKDSRDGATRTQGTWYYYDVDLSAFAGKGYIAIRHYNCSDMFYLNIDDVAFGNASKWGGTTYSIYRAHCDGSGMQLVADNVTGNEYIDTEWTLLVPGIYKYGVCAVSDGIRGAVNWIEPESRDNQPQLLTREAAERMGIEYSPTAFDGSMNLLEEGRLANRSTWDLLGSYSCSSSYQYGVATDGVNIYHSAWSSSAGFQFAKYDMEGNFIETFDIDGCGYLRDMTYDGQYFYGGSGSNTLYCIDLANKQLISSISTECDAIRYCAYDPVRDGFWVGNWSTNIQCISRTGSTLVTGPTGISFSGATYYMDNNKVEHIYMFAQPSSDAVVYDYNIADNTISSSPIFSISSNLTDATGSSGGCCIGYYAGKVALFAAVQQSPNMVGIFELKDGPFAWSNCIEKLSLNQQTINLSQGTNWFSTYVEITKEDLQNALLATLSDPTGTIIKSQDGNSTYRSGRWRDQNFVWDVAKMYMIVLPEDCVITLTGLPINPADHPITIAPNAPTWIGFPFPESKTPAEAIPAGFAVNGDIIKGMEGNIRYNNGNWRAQGINSLEPGQGYIYNSAAAGERTLIFPTSAK